MIGDVEVYSESKTPERSPGKYPQHYSPLAKVILVENDLLQKEKTIEIASDMESKGHKVGVMAKQEHEDAYRSFNVKILGPEEDFKICASRLFSTLREFDSESMDIIIAESIVEKGLGLAIMNRLRKASGPDSAVKDQNSSDNIS